MSKCANCSAGPRGSDGHLDLFVTKMTGGTMQFKCRTCGATWMRGQGEVWTEAVGNELGATLPRAAKSEN